MVKRKKSWFIRIVAIFVVLSFSITPILNSVRVINHYGYNQQMVNDWQELEIREISNDNIAQVEEEAENEEVSNYYIYITLLLFATSIGMIGYLLRKRLFEKYLN